MADAGKCKMYMKNFGEFYNNQITHAGTIVLSRSQKLSDEKLAAAVELLRSLNTEAAIITPDAKPSNNFCKLGAIRSRNKKTIAAPSDVPRNGNSKPTRTSLPIVCYFNFSRYSINGVKSV